jgi:hypothetical protein
MATKPVDVPEFPRGYVTGGGLVPVPDPTVLTTQQLRQEINSLREIIEARISGQEHRFEAIEITVSQRKSDIETGVGHVQSLLDEKIKTYAEKMGGQLDTLIAETAEKFAGVAAQFSERDTRTDQRAGDTKLAVDAAFAAAKEATAKIEAGFTKQIDSITGIIDTKTANLDGRITDVKDAVNRMTGHTRGIGDSWGILVAVIMAGLVIVEIVLRQTH